MMTLDHGRSSFAAFDHIRVNGSLRQNMYVPQLFRFLFKDPDEFLADDPALSFRLRHACQLFQEALLCIDPDQVHTEALPEDPLHILCFALSEEPMVHEYADQCLTDRLM